MKKEEYFSKFKRSVERSFGCSLEVLARVYPDIYPHQVLSHGFMEYLWEKLPQGKIIARIERERGSYNPKNSQDKELFLQYLKEEYFAWARANKLEESLLELGWKEYLED